MRLKNEAKAGLRVSFVPQLKLQVIGPNLAIDRSQPITFFERWTYLVTYLVWLKPGLRVSVWPAAKAGRLFDFYVTLIFKVRIDMSSSYATNFLRYFVIYN